MLIVKCHFERRQKKIIFKMEERRIFITWAACLGSNMFDWSNVILQYFEKKDKFIFLVN